MFQNKFLCLYSGLTYGFCENFNEIRLVGFALAPSPYNYNTHTDKLLLKSNLLDSGKDSTSTFYEHNTICAYSIGEKVI